MEWIWIIVLVAAIVVEIFTEQMISIWFVPAALVAMVMEFLSVPPIWQVVAFLILTVAGIIFAKTYLIKKFPLPDHKTNIEAIIGEKCVVTERIDNYAGCGQAKIKGQIWSARGAHEDDVFDEGEILTVVAIEGVKLICVKK
jgi:membrane protein implicated in regulation of membrane protease activity